MPWVRKSFLAPALAWVAACSSPKERALPDETVRAGYPPGVVRLAMNVTLSQRKQCHATLVHPSWVLTAAHCFSGVRPGAWGQLETSSRIVNADDVWLHPSALTSGQTRLVARFSAEQIRAAHDLALLRLDRPEADPAGVTLWAPGLDLAAGAGALSGRQLTFGRFRGDQEQTGHADIVGLVRASDLVGPDQPESLLAARGDAVTQGDSGGGVFAATALPDGGSGPSRLVGVVQNANLEDPRDVFGIVPLWTHAGWIDEVLAANMPHPAGDR